MQTLKRAILIERATKIDQVAHTWANTGRTCIAAISLTLYPNITTALWACLYAQMHHIQVVYITRVGTHSHKATETVQIPADKSCD